MAQRAKNEIKDVFSLSINYTIFSLTCPQLPPMSEAELSYWHKSSYIISVTLFIYC